MHTLQSVFEWDFLTRVQLLRDFTLASLSSPGARTLVPLLTVSSDSRVSNVKVCRNARQPNYAREQPVAVAVVHTASNAPDPI